MSASNSCLCTMYIHITYIKGNKTYTIGVETYVCIFIQYTYTSNLHLSIYTTILQHCKIYICIYFHCLHLHLHRI